MKKIILSLLSTVLIATNASAELFLLPEKDPFMGDYKNQFAVGIGQGFDTGLIVPPPVHPVPFYILSMQYSQPTTFFRIPARRSLNVSQTVGLASLDGWDWNEYSIPMGYITEDIALLRSDDFYMAVGAGAGFQTKQNNRIGSKFLFQFKVTFGYNINDEFALELYLQHFSNGNTAPQNESYAFYGLNLVRNF
ncbi:MAG: acyloxyacyl hydrolase [Alphaproteobacteria bacterium]|nr:acyloxyacyl hydrolase [Alphaproteobacteria bacterium]